MQISILTAFLVLLGTAACKDNELKGNETNGVDRTLQGKPDKGSEEPVGVPGYPLACKWISALTGEPPVGIVDCFLSDANGQPASLSEVPVWKVSYEGPARITTSLINQSIRISAAGKNLIEVNSALLEMQVTVAFKGGQRILSGRDVLKTQPGEWRFVSDCQNGFVLLAMDSTGGYSVNISDRFTDCELLSSRLMNLVIPNASIRNLPDTHKGIGGSCSNGLFTLTLAQTQTITVGPFSPQACLDLSSFVNSMSL
ncbi:MAG: hypothetical protein M3Q07_07810 [Pseudobdellovibrionaceae bacterium]|nr:hypothetical protein [Pseudobdellovibrionaceae bacterium]